VKVLVTGGSGFLGTAVVQCLLRENHVVLTISRSRPEEVMQGRLDWLQVDLGHSTEHRDSVRKFAPEVVVHLAWQGIPDYSLEISKANLKQSLEFLSFVVDLESCRKVLVAGSCWELNRVMGACLETEVGTPKDDFTRAKHALRSWLEGECERRHIDLGWMRIFYLYGPRQRAKSLIPSLLNHLRDGKLPKLHSPRNSYDFVYVKDAAVAFERAVSRDLSSGIYHLGSGVATPVVDICRMAERIVNGSEILTRKLELDTANTSCTADFWADCSWTRQELGWIPETSLDEGIFQTWQWITQQ